jgi:hypothetical protein
MLTVAATSRHDHGNYFYDGYSGAPQCAKVSVIMPVTWDRVGDVVGWPPGGSVLSDLAATVGNQERSLREEGPDMNRATLYIMPRNHPNTRFSVSLPADLAESLRVAADQRFHGNISAAIADAVGDWVRGEQVLARGIAAMEEYQAEYGTFTAEETAIARADVAELMGWDADDPRRLRDQTA